MQEIFQRRSVRSYLTDPISEEQLEKVLRAGMYAPSANNQQPWEFIVIDDRKLLDEIPKFHPYSKMLLEAPIAIIVCGNADKEKSPGAWWVQDCSAAIQNMLLEATHLELGSVWLGLYPREERVEGIRKLLNLPSQITPLAIVVLGHAKEPPKPANRDNPGCVHRNQW